MERPVTWPSPAKVEKLQHEHFCSSSCRFTFYILKCLRNVVFYELSNNQTTCILGIQNCFLQRTSVCNCKSAVCPLTHWSRKMPQKVSGPCERGYSAVLLLSADPDLAPVTSHRTAARGEDKWVSRCGNIVDRDRDSVIPAQPATGPRAREILGDWGNQVTNWNLSVFLQLSQFYWTLISFLYKTIKNHQSTF